MCCIKQNSNFSINVFGFLLFLKLKAGQSCEQKLEVENYKVPYVANKAESPKGWKHPGIAYNPNQRLQSSLLHLALHRRNFKMESTPLRTLTKNTWSNLSQCTLSSVAMSGHI